MKRTRRIMGAVKAVDNGKATEDREPKTGLFKKGNKAAVGRRNKGFKIAEALHKAVSAQAMREIVLAVIKKAKAGDVAAASWLADRVIGKPRQEDSPLIVLPDLPEVKGLKSAGEALAVIVQRAADGELSPEEAIRFARLVKESARVLDPKAWAGHDSPIDTGFDLLDMPDPTFL